MRRIALITLALTLLTAGAEAQQSIGTIVGHLRTPAGAATRPIRIEVEEVMTEAHVETAEVDPEGNFTLRNLPFATYDLYVVAADGRARFARRVLINSSVGVRLEIDASSLTLDAKEITVSDTHLESSRTSVHTLFTGRAIESLPVSTPAKGIEAVLMNSPSVVPDEDGRLHMRGEDAMLQFIIDGIPLTTNQTRIYAPLLPTNIIESADMLRGSLDPEFGVATSGILNVTTRSGFDERMFANGGYSLGSFNTREGSVDVGGHIGQSVAYYAAYGQFSSDRYLDPVSGFDPDHTNGSGKDGFAKINIIASDNLDVVAIGYYGKTDLGIPNHVASSTQDQNATLTSSVVGVRANYSVSDIAAMSLLLYTRKQTSDLTSNGIDRISNAADIATALLSERYFVGAHRTDEQSGAQLEYSLKNKWIGNDDEFKFGLGGEVYPLSEYLTFAVTDTNISSPYVAGGDDRMAPYDLRRGGRPFLVDTSATGKRISAYLQDRVTIGDWTVSGGLRFDHYDLLTSESGLSPRINAIYRASDQLILRVSYDRMFTQAPLENVLVSSSSAAGQLVGADQGSAPRIVQSEKAHVLELGAGYRLNQYVSLDLTGYGKLIDDMVVKVELGNSGVIFPANIKNGIVAGGELEVLLRDWHNFSGRLAFATTVSKGVVPSDGSSPFAAGLVLGEEGENYSHPFGGEDMFNTEHNQLMTASFVIRWDHPESGFFATLGGRFDSGLPFDLVNTNGVGPDVARSQQILLQRGYSQSTIDMLTLTSELPGSPDKYVAPHATFDATIGYDLEKFGVPLRITGGVTNILNTPYLIKFESTFGGTHFGAPRMYSLRAALTL